LAGGSTRHELLGRHAAARYGRPPGGGSRGLGRLARLVCVAAEGMAAACVVVLLAGHVSFSDAVNAYLVTKLGMMVTFAAIVLRPVAGSPRSGAGSPRSGAGAHPGV
jgi:hypothetical protein